MLAAVHRPDVDKGMGVVDRRADYRIDVFLLKTPPPVNIRSRSGEFFGGRCKIILVYITQRHDVFTFDVVQIGAPSPANADNSNIQLFVRRIAGPEDTRLQDNESRTGHCALF